MAGLSRNADAAAEATFTGGGVPFGATPQGGSAASRALEQLALQWFAQMRSGEIDRSQLAHEYRRHLTDDSVQNMAQHLAAYAYGASPLYASLLRSEAVGTQTFHVVRIAFPRGDAASLMFGFDKAGKITGIALLSMAGD